MSSKLEIPKRKPNHFYVYDKNKNKYNDIKYISQNTMSKGFIQIIPQIGPKKLINHFNITLAFLPPHLWKKIKKNVNMNDDNSYNIIKDGITRYTIAETNQDDLMLTLYTELYAHKPDATLIANLVSEIDDSQHTSWLILRANFFLKSKIMYISEPVTAFI